MPSLRDLLDPNSLRINIGSVYRMKLKKEDGVIPKKGDDSRNKYFVVIGIDDEDNIIGYTLINTNINNGLSEELKLLQYPISHEEYAFLEGKSRYIDCSEIKSLKKDRFLNLYRGKEGEISTDDLSLIRGALKTSPKVTKKELKRFGLE